MTLPPPPSPRFFILRMLHNCSIRHKLLSVMMITSCVAMFLTGAAFTLYQSLSFNSRLLKGLSSQAEVISHNSAAALAFMDPDDGVATLRSLQANDSMLTATLFDSKGVILSFWSRNESAPIPPFSPDWQGLKREGNNLLMARKITKGGQFLGTLLLRSDTRQMTIYLQNSILVMTLLFLLSTGMTLMLSNYLEGIISGPINYLAQIMSQVATRQQYSLRSSLSSKDELGALSQYFNTMLSAIEHRDKQLQEGQDRLQSIIDNTNSVIYLKDPKGRYLMVNRRFREVVLTRDKKIIDKTDADLFPQELADAFSNFDAEVLHHGSLLEQEELAPHDDGLHTYISAKFPLRRPDESIYAICGISTDISRRKRAETELRELQSYLDNVIDSMPSALIGIDAKGRITRWNHEAELLSGLPQQEATGRPLDSVLPEFADQLVKVLQAISQRQSQPAEQVSFMKDGVHLYKEMTVYPLVANGIEGAVLRIDDVTERVQIEEMMIQTEKMMSVGGLAAGMAHEINNPLGIMIQAVQNIERRVSPTLEASLKAAEECQTTVHAYLKKRMVLTLIEDIREAGARAAAIVANMLQFSRRSESAKQAVDIPTLIEQTIALAANDYDLKKRFDFRHITITRDYPTELPMIRVIPTEIEQVILNLLKNSAQAIAAQHAPKSSPAITIRIRYNDKYMSVSIEDNGPGIPKDIRKRIFEPFFTTKAVGSGTGLGLSVSYMIITNNHKGSLEVQSLPPQGTRFIFSLPFS